MWWSDENRKVWLDGGMDIRHATIDDARILLEWRNDPLTRAMSKTTEPVAWDDHLKWMERRLAREEPNLFIALRDGVPVGTFRVDDDEVSYTVAPPHRGNGLATAMITWAVEMFGPLKAEIKRENLGSISAATKGGALVVLID